jgi:hypothetical protein
VEQIRKQRQQVKRAEDELIEPVTSPVTQINVDEILAAIGQALRG